MLALAAGFGTASSSCSYAAVELAAIIRDLVIGLLITT
jgi:hypothetical protein